MTKIQFEAGTSRHGDYGVNFLMGTVAGSVLYAETALPEGASEDYGYLTLKAEILSQAEENGISPSDLEFWYDGQEDALETDASAGCDIKGW